MKKRALISVSDKTNIKNFAESLLNLNYEIISTGGTYDLIKGENVYNVSDITNFPEILDGRVKTLHPKIHGGILADTNNPEHLKALELHEIIPFDIVCVNLYPFKESLKKNLSETELTENIDIGGPAMIRASAKNYKCVSIIVDSADYGIVLDELKSGEVKLKTKKMLAAKAFRHTAAYDALIAGYMTENSKTNDEDSFPEKLTLTYDFAENMRYGENPHQKAALYKNPITAASLVSAKQLQGKELSYNNYADLNTAVEIVNEFTEPAAVAVKHQNPCAVATSDDLPDAVNKMYEGDPISIFGGIIALNKTVDGKSAEFLSKIMLDVIAAPQFSDDAIKIFSKKKNLRLLVTNDIKKSKHVYTHINGGLLVQDSDLYSIKESDLSYPTLRKPTNEELSIAKFAWTVIKYVKSNGILVAGNNMTLGIGPGQTNRVGAAKIALAAAGEKAKGAVLASDAFFPMPDTVEEAAKAGIGIIIQPGGSIKDSLSVEACDRNNIGMIYTGVRHFRH